MTKARKEPRSIHEPVLVSEVVSALNLDSIALSNNQAHSYIDATIGSGGHSLEILKRGGVLLGIDADENMLEIAGRRLKSLACPTPFKLIQANFRDIDRIARENGFEKVSGILFDLGVSNIHFLSDDRGFSFTNAEAPLDMRLDPKSQGVKASDLLNALRFDQLVDLFGQTMEKGSARWLSKRIVGKRANNPILTVGDFLNITRDLKGKPGLNSATLPFLALRIATNNELDNLKEVLPKSLNLLTKGGRLAVISFHSGEDSVVKNFFKNSGENIITPEPIRPSEEEIGKNPRARSAKLRILEKK